MDIERPKNTKHKGFVEFFIYPEGKRFVGVCLTFDIVEEHKDPNKLRESLHRAALLHFKVVVENNLPDALLNRYAPQEYWEKYFAYLDALSREANRTGVLSKSAVSTVQTLGISEFRRSHMPALANA
ncbi:MAG: hypothetical protein Q8R13_04175 [bacterium]|nr:hypothetical protein [bacterium]MDZ4296477.1 hypothetical protein [Patescibacteria group bacterium]